MYHPSTGGELFSAVLSKKLYLDLCFKLISFLAKNAKNAKKNC